MEDKKGDKSKGGEVMVAIWFGTQADEAFAEAWHSKAANVHFDGLCSIKSKVYLSPKLWYLREKGSSMMRYPELFAKVQVGNQTCSQQRRSRGESSFACFKPRKATKREASNFEVVQS
ncbi:hypothetical protein BC332_34942 [Capsicum chinense]|nr:hypothetical protein BC332_34942 [Capsicum chinense]